MLDSVDDNLKQYADALAWRAQVSAPNALVWLNRTASKGLDSREVWRTNNRQDKAALWLAHTALFGERGFPQNGGEAGLDWRRDPLGKPFVLWSGDVLAWGDESGCSDTSLHVSNSHDGDAHLLFAVYAPQLAGLGVDVLHLPRLISAKKDRAYLLRLAKHFFSEEEGRGMDRLEALDSLEELRLCVATHFSLMESVSKALGTGLKMGLGMGRDASLPKNSIGVRALSPKVELHFSGEAEARRNAIQATHAEAYWGVSGDYLVSAVLLWNTMGLEGVG